MLSGIKKKKPNIHLLFWFFLARRLGENDTTGTIRAEISLIFSIRNDTSNLGVLVRGPEKGWLPLSRRGGTASGGKSKVVSICYKDPSLRDADRLTFGVGLIDISRAAPRFEDIYIYIQHPMMERRRRSGAVIHRDGSTGCGQ